MPTICDYAGIVPPENMRGRSLRPLVEGNQEREAWREYVVTELSFGNWVDEYNIDTFPRARMLRTIDYKYVVFNQGEMQEQLMNMEKDPGEMKNLALDPQYQKELNMHRELLQEWIRETDDSFILLLD